MRHNNLRLAICLIAVLRVVPCFAGVDGQPQPDAALKTRLSNAARWFLTPQKNVGRERADFLLLLEKAPSADITDVIAPALGDDAAYQGTVATFEDALDAAKDENTKLFLRYNIARTHLLRARLSPVSVGKNSYAEAATQALEPFDTNNRDTALWELKGDIEAERGNTSGAIAAYQKIGPAGGSAALATYKIAQVWQRARRYPEAQAAYELALQRDAASTNGNGELYHRIYQGLASLYIDRGDFSSAVNALNRSAKIKPDAGSFPFLLDAARALLKHGYNTPVVGYLEAAVKQSPDDVEAAMLLRQARGI
jgi:tetratricopeptide (TPR) repeat protein